MKKPVNGTLPGMATRSMPPGKKDLEFGSSWGDSPLFRATHPCEDEGEQQDLFTTPNPTDEA